MSAYLPDHVGLRRNAGTKTRDAGGLAVLLRVLLASFVACALAGVLAPVASASSVSDLTVSANTHAAGASEVVYEVLFTPTTAIPQGGSVRLTAPAGTVFPAAPAFDYAVGAAGSEPKQVKVGPEGTGANVVELVLKTAQTAGKPLRLIARGISNPASEDPEGSASLATSTDTTPVSVAFPITGPTSVSGLSVSANTFSAGAQEAVYSVTFTVREPFSGGDSVSGGYLRLFAPSGGTFSQSGYYEVNDLTTGAKTIVSGEGQLQVDPEGLGQNVVDVSVSAAAGDTLEVIAHGVSNPTSGGAATFGVSTSSDILPVTQPVTIAPTTRVSKVSVHASSTTAHATEVLYTVSFRANQPIATSSEPADDADGYIKLGVSLPEEAGAVEVSNGSTHGIAPKVAEGKIFLPEDVPVAAGNSVLVTVHGASNPLKANASAKLKVSTSSDVTPYGVALPIGPATAVSGVTASANSELAGASGVSYQVSFIADQSLPTGAQASGLGGDSFIRLTLPHSARALGTASSYVVSVGSSSAPAPAVQVITPAKLRLLPDPTQVVNPEVKGATVVDVMVPAGLSIAPGDTVTVTAPGIANPVAANPEATLSVSTSADWTLTTVPFPIAPSGAPGAVASAVSSTTPGEANVTYTVAATTVHSLIGGNRAYVQVGFPAGTVMPAAPSAYQLTDENSDTTAPAAGVVLDSTTHLVYVYLPSAMQVPAGDTVSVKISGVTNPPAPFSEALTAATSSDPTLLAAAAPTDLALTETGTESVSLSWTPPAATAGTLTGYVVTPYVLGVAQPPEVFESPATSETVTGLRSGTAYTFKVAALTEAGTGPSSAASGSATPG